MSEPGTATLLFFQCLTREEWKLCFAVTFLADSEDYGPHFDLLPYASPGVEGDSDSWLESFRRVVRWLSFEHGFVWHGLEPHRDGRITAEGLVEPRNAIFFNQLSGGQSPDIADAMEMAILMLRDGAPSVKLEVFRAALADVRDAVARVPQGDPDIEKQADRFADQALAAVGVVRGPETVN